MTLPAAAQFPTATPFPAAQPAGLFGLTADERELTAFAPGLGGDPKPIAGTSWSAEQAGSQFAILGQVTGGGLDSDPRGWTPETASAQTDRALARIGAVNPELAQNIAAQRGQSADKGEDLPWWKDILHGVGEFMQVTHLDDVFELLGRPEKAVLEVIHDWGDESVWKNMSDGLMGHSELTFSDVLVEDFGMERSKLTAVLGFVGDVALDPITYVTMGVGAVGRRAAGMAAAKAGVLAELSGVVAKEGAEGVIMSNLRKAVGQGAEASLDETAAALLGTVDVAARASEKAGTGLSKLLDVFRKNLDSVHPDAAPGLLSWTAEQGEAELLRLALRSGDNAFKLATTSGILRTKAGVFDAMGLDKAEVVKYLKADISKGTSWTMPFTDKAREARQLYNQGKAAAGALGGWRFRASFSPFGLRIAPHRIPLMPAKLDFSMGRRFFAGLSGQQRLMKMVAAKSATAQDLEIFWRKGADGGFDGLRKHSPEVYKQLGGHGQSIFIPLSEGVGRVTAHLSGHAAALRGGGLGAKVAGDLAAQSKHMKQAVTDEIETVVVDDKVVLSPDAVNQHFNDTQKAFEKGGGTQEELASLMEDAERLQGPEYWRQRAIDERLKQRTPGGSTMDPDKVARYDQLQHEAEALEVRVAALDKTTPGVADAVRNRRIVAKQRQAAADRAGISSDFTDDELLNVDHIHPDDAATEAQRMPEQLRDVEWDIEGEGGLRDFTDASEGGTIGRGRVFKQRARQADAPAAKAVPAAELDEVVRDLTGGIGEGMFDAPIADPLADELKRLARDNTGNVEMADIQGAIDRAAGRSGLTAEETAQQFGTTLDEVRRAKAGVMGEAETADLAARAKYQPRPQNPLFRDKTPLVEGAGREASQVVDPVDEMVAQYTTFLDDLKQGKGVPEEMDADVVEDMQRIIAKEGSKEAQLGPIVADRLRKDGFDSIATKQADGSWELVMLTPGKGQGAAIAAARINPMAPRLSEGLGRATRTLSESAFSAVGDVKNGKRMIRRWLRASAKMRRPQAETYLQQQLKTAGHGLRDGERALESDILRIHRAATDEVASAARDRYIGRAAQEMESLGFTRGAYGMGPVGVARYEYVVSDEGMTALKGLSNDIQAAADRATAFVNEVDLPRLTAEANQTAQRLSRYEQQYDDIIEGVGDVSSSVDAGTLGKYLDPAMIRKAGKDGRFGLKSKDEFEALVEDIRANGIKDPVTIEYHAASGKGVVTDGYHRLAAAEAAGVTDIPYVIQKVTKAGPTDVPMKDFVEGAAERAKALQKTAAADARKAKQALEDARLKHVEAVNEAQKVMARMTTERAPTLPALVNVADAKNMTGMTAVEFPGFEGMAMPTFMAEEFKRSMEGYKKLSDVHGGYRRFNSWWKTWATYMWPGFHARNMAGAYFNNWLGGVAFHDYVTMSRIRRAERELYHGAKGKWAATKVMSKDGDIVRSLRRNGTPHLNGKRVEDLTYADLAKVSGEMNVTASNGRAFAEARLTVDEVEKKTEKTIIQSVPVVRGYEKLARGAGTLTENSFRTAAWVRGLRDSGSVMEARAFTMVRHGDYEDLTDWEYGVIRDLIPFYKWMRTNTPLQIHNLLEAPGKLMAVKKLQGAAFEAQGMDWDKEKYKVPDWMQESFLLPGTPDKDGAWQAAMLDLPMADMFMSGRDFFSTLLPVARPLLENYVYNQNTFTGAPIEGKPVMVAEGVETALAPIMPLLRAIGVVKKNDKGEQFITDKTQNLLGIIPMFSRSRNWLYGDPERVKLRVNSFMSAVMGIGLRPVDQQSMSDTELDFYYTNVLPQLDHLKAMGMEVPTTDDIAATLGTTDQVLSSLGIISSADKFAPGG